MYVVTGCVCVGGVIFYLLRLPGNHQIGAKVVDARLGYIAKGESHLGKHFIHPILDATLGQSCAMRGGQRKGKQRQ